MLTIFESLTLGALVTLTVLVAKNNKNTELLIMKEQEAIELLKATNATLAKGFDEVKAAAVAAADVIRKLLNQLADQDVSAELEAVIVEARAKADAIDALNPDGGTGGTEAPPS